MIETNYIQIIEKLIELTNDNKIKWDYLDNRPDVYEKMNMVPCSPLDGEASGSLAIAFIGGGNRKKFDSDNSFIAEINGNYIIIFSRPSCSTDNTTIEKVSIIFVPRTFKDIDEFKNEDEEKLRLFLKVKSLFPSVEDIMKDILKL